VGGDGRARPLGADALLGEHGHHVGALRVLGQQGEGVAPAPLGREPARHRLGRAGAQPRLAAAGGAAEAEGGDAAADHRGRGYGQPEQVGDQEPERLVAEEAAEAVGPAESAGQGHRGGRLQLPEDGVGLADAGDQGMDAELDPLAGVAGQVRHEPVDGAQQGPGGVVAEGDRARALDRPGRVPRGELDHAAHGDPGDATVVDVDGLVGDRVQARAGAGPQHRQDVVAAGQAVGERPAPGPGLEAADVDRAAGGGHEAVDRVLGGGEPVVGPVAAQAGVPLRQLRVGAEADELGDVGMLGETAEQLVLERRHGTRIEGRQDTDGRTRGAGRAAEPDRGAVRGP
jgi:hypothetical protein